MYNWNNYDNDIAYSYDDYVGDGEEHDEDYEEYAQDNYDYEKYQEDMIDLLYNEINN